ncbi:MAG: hypothetical protein FJ137_16505 [Deltaproteobacteria bacterium]|nr:hypothetical protein [Deltaproteobacteria bacterium]
MSNVAVVPAQPHGMIAVVDALQARDVVDAVDAAAAHWTRRGMFPLDFYTLGAASYLDAIADVDAYAERAVALNPVLAAHFAGLYDVVIARLSTVFGPCALCTPLAYPGFHVFGHRPGHENNRVTIQLMQGLSASIHSDRQFEPHGAVWARFADVDLQQTMTFTLALELPTRGGGLCFWGDPSVAVYDDDGDYARYLKRDVDFRGQKGVEPPCVIPYRVGALFYFLGAGRHVIAPSWNLSPTDRRITLQGHGTRCDGVWRLYF